MTDSVIKTPDLDYSIHKVLHSNTRWTKITSQNQASFSTTSFTTSSGLFELIIPASVVNLSKSRLQFGVSLVPAATVVPILASQAGCYFNRCSLSTLSGTLLADISNVNKFLQMVLPMSTSYEELTTYTQGMPQSSSLGAVNAVSLQATLALSKTTPNGALQRSDTPFIAAGTAGSTNIIGDLARHPAQHIGTKFWNYSAPVNTEGHQWFDVALGELFKHTLLSVDKSLYFAGESLSLQLYYDAPQAYAITSTLATTNLETGTITAGSTFTLTSPVLYLAQEMNLDLAREVMDKCQSGLELPFSYVYGSKQVFSASSQQTVQQTINSSLGSSLLFFATAPFDSTDSGPGANSNAIISIERNNITATALSNYNTFIDSIPIQAASGFDITLSEHYRANQENFQGACAPLSITEFGYNFTHVDNFCGQPLHVLGSNGQTMINGMSLGMNRVWSLQANWAASIAKNWYNFWSVQRILEIKGGRVSVK